MVFLGYRVPGGGVDRRALQQRRCISTLILFVLEIGYRFGDCDCLSRALLFAVLGKSDGAFIVFCSLILEV